MAVKVKVRLPAKPEPPRRKRKVSPAAAAARRTAQHSEVPRNQLTPKARKAKLKWNRNNRIANWIKEADLIAKYPQVMPGTIRQNPSTKQRQVTIQCQESGCDETRETTTSNLRFVHYCSEHQRAHSLARRKEMDY